MRHFFVSGVVVTTSDPPHFQIMEEAGAKQTCIAMVPFNKNHRDGRELARVDATLIVDALNFYEEEHST